MDSDIARAVKECGLVFDGSRIIVDHQFRTLDPCIYATGSSSKFSRRFRAKFDTSESNSREIGVAAANSVLETIEPMLETRNTYDVVHHHHHHENVADEEDHLPDLRLPKDTVSRLVNGYVRLLFVFCYHSSIHKRTHTRTGTFRGTTLGTRKTNTCVGNSY